MGALKLYWWQGEPNFGDVLSERVTANVSGRSVAHAIPKQAELFAIGSLMHLISKKYAGRIRDWRGPRSSRHRPVLWGTGVMRPVPTEFLDHVDIALLRGPVSAALLGIKDCKFGDPGLLAPRVFKPGQRQDQIGLVPHWTSMDDPRIAQLCADEARVRLIDPRDPVEDVCLAISECAHVVASSLHGLIVADSYGIPNTWLDPVSLSYLKYHDYAGSVGRAMASPRTLDDVVQSLTRLPTGSLPYADEIDAARDALVSSFPAALRAA